MEMEASSKRPFSCTYIVDDTSFFLYLPFCFSLIPRPINLLFISFLPDRSMFIIESVMVFSRFPIILENIRSADTMKTIPYIMEENHRFCIGREFVAMILIKQGGDSYIFRKHVIHFLSLYKSIRDNFV